MTDHENQLVLSNLLKYYTEQKLGIKFPTQVRHLATHEIRIARSVFEEQIPYERVHISDGYGQDHRPYTIPVPWTFPRRYCIMAGDGYFGMSTVKEDKSTLIHELTHVWQGQHDKVAYTYVVESLRAQRRLGDQAYAYDKTNYKDWDSYNVEQQAQIVEDWYGVASSTQRPDTAERRPDGSIDRAHDDSLDGEDDPRYRYIVENIRGKMMAPRPKVVEAIPETYRVSQHDTLAPVSDDYMIGLLKRRFRADDVAGYGGRLREVESVFRTMGTAQAVPLYTRLTLRRPGDKLAQYFHDDLSTAARQSLLGILRTRMAP